VLLLASAAFAQEPNGAIEGVVADSVSHMPVKKAQVVLMGGVMMAPPQAGRRFSPPQPKSAVTDAGGGFSFHDLPPGRYDLQVFHQRYPMSRNGMARQTVVLKPGEKASRVTVELMPGAAVSGRVLDEDGDPVVGCFVQVHPPKNGMRGPNNLGAEPTNENGEYRVYGIQPGKYIVAAHCQQPLFQPRPLSAGPPPPPSFAYPSQFFPLTNDPASAEVIEFAAGAEKSGLDFQLTRAPVYTVRVSLTSAGAEWRNRNDLNVSLVPRGSMIATLSGAHGGRLDRTTGTFEFQSVFPGYYTLVAYTRGEPDKVGARQPLEVVDRAVEANLELRPAMDLTGAIEFEGDRKFPLSQITLQLIPAEPGPVPPVQARVRDDGTFTISSLLPSAWRVQMYAQSAFIKSMWLGNQELKERILDTSSGAAGPLRIVLSAKTASIRAAGPPGQSIYMTPTGNDLTFRQHYQAVINPSGEFLFSGLAPGKYRLYLAGPGAPMPEEGGQEVTVSEGETVSVDVKQQANVK
jgi:hypothetical protein